VILAEGDYVIVHGRFSNIGLPVNWIAADVARLKDGILVETLGRHSGRGYRATVQERESDVRRRVPEVNTSGTSLNNPFLCISKVSMDDLLKLAIEPHGGLEQSRQFKAVKASATITGGITTLKDMRSIVWSPEGDLNSTT
jgi:hypothetical protein